MVQKMTILSSPVILQSNEMRRYTCQKSLQLLAKLTLHGLDIATIAQCCKLGKLLVGWLLYLYACRTILREVAPEI